MCGRFVSTTPISVLAETFAATNSSVGGDRPNFNVTPRSSILYVTMAIAGERVLGRARWGLIPSWSKDPAIGDKMINARSETIREKPSFRSAFARRRCLIPVDGFYEWHMVPGSKVKQPVFIKRADGGVTAFAGIYEDYSSGGDPEAPLIRSCSIITTSANAMIAPVHHRMPVVLMPEVFDEWLDPTNNDTDELHSLLVPAPDEYLSYYPVSTEVNRPSNNGPELIEPLATLGA